MLDFLAEFPGFFQAVAVSFSGRGRVFGKMKEAANSGGLVCGFNASRDDDHAPDQERMSPRSFDDLRCRAGEQRRRHSKAERLGGLKIRPAKLRDAQGPIGGRLGRGFIVEAGARTLVAHQ
jgi:hypothetical protein